MQSKYEVIGIVGEGAYGIVYKCRNKENGDFVAIKKFKETEDDIVKKTMSRELRALQSLKHENIVEYKEAFKRKGNLYLVFEYVEKNLLEILQEFPKGLDPNLIKNLIFQLCFVIKYLHSFNVVHRDIKPENLLIDSKYKLKLCDFGFAKNIKINKESLTDYVATRWYRAPELLTGEGVYGTEVDFWAIGCIMGELADGDPLFPGENELDQVKVIQKVIGKLTDEQTELILKKNQKIKASAFDIIKPETLERRYMGKLPKVAISFMKALLHPDPKQRLKGDNVFQHPYLEEFASMIDLNNDNNNNKDLSKITGQVTATNNASQPSQIGKTLTLLNKKTSEEPRDFKELKEKYTLKENENILTKKVTQPIINTTTNINIINYNNFNDGRDNKENKENKEKSEKVFDLSSPRAGGGSNVQNLVKSININEEKYLHEKKLNKKDDLIQTSSSFYKNKDNMLSIYGNQNIDENFNTFYNKEKYNYDIDLKALPNKKSVSPDDKDKKKNCINGQTKNQTNYNINGDYYNEKSHSKGKKKGYENKFKANNVIKEESYQSKPSVTKYDGFNKAGINKTIYNFHLPTITNKGYQYKKK